MKRTATACLVVFLNIPSTGAFAASGTYDITSCFGGTTTMVSQSKDLTVLSTDAKGISFSNGESKDFDKNTIHCVGLVKITPESRSQNGYCKYMEPNGDFIVGEYERIGGPEGTWRFLQGTGKWAGISGGGTNQVTKRGKPISPGTFQTCGRAVGTYTLP